MFSQRRVCILLLISLGFVGFSCKFVAPVPELDANQRFAWSPPKEIGGPTLKDPTKFSFVFFADFQVDDRLKEDIRVPALRPFRNYLKKNPVDFLLSGGDNTQSGLKAEYTFIDNKIKELGLPVYWCIGNHDLFGNGWKNWQALYGTATRKVKVGNTSIYLLDNAGGTIGKSQRQWLETKLKEDHSTHRVVVMHFAMYPGNHYDLDGQPHYREVYTLSALFDTYNVKHVFAGHSHIYREVKINKVEHTIISALKEDSPHKTILRIDVDGDSFKKTVIPFQIEGYGK